MIIMIYAYLREMKEFKKVFDNCVWNMNMCKFK